MGRWDRFAARLEGAAGADPYRVFLANQQRSELRGLVGAGIASSRLLTRARILLKADHGEGGSGWSDAAIAGAPPAITVHRGHPPDRRRRATASTDIPSMAETSRSVRSRSSCAFVSARYAVNATVAAANSGRIRQRANVRRQMPRRWAMISWESRLVWHRAAAWPICSLVGPIHAGRCT